MTKLVILGRKSKTGNYEAFFRALPAQIVTTLVPGEVISCDALILPGGGDITPAFFGEKNKGSRTVDTELDILQFQALDIAIAAGIPVIGICKGMQVINVAFGGTITQDMPEDCLHSSPSGDVFHDTIMVDDSRLFKYFPAKMRVNSAHHQRIGRLGQHLKIIQVCPDDGCPEALEHDELPILGLQWHPDFNLCNLEQGTDDPPQHLCGLIVHFLQCGNYRIHTLFPICGKGDQIVRL